MKRLSYRNLRPRKVHMLSRIALLLISAVFLDAVAHPFHSTTRPVAQEQIVTLVTRAFGPNARTDVTTGREPWMPRYIWTAFTETSQPVLVTVIHVDGTKGTLNTRPVRAITGDGRETPPDDTIGTNCLALAFFHGLPATMRPDINPTAIYMLYECFSGYTRVAKDSSLLRNAHVHAAGEAVLLDLETGGQLLVYWDRGRYRTKLVRMGD